MTTRFSLSLPQHQARLLYLALVYHLVRPGNVGGCVNRIDVRASPVPAPIYGQALSRP